MAKVYLFLPPTRECGKVMFSVCLSTKGYLSGCMSGAKSGGVGYPSPRFRSGSGQVQVWTPEAGAWAVCLLQSHRRTFLSYMYVVVGARPILRPYRSLNMKLLYWWICNQAGFPLYYVRCYLLVFPRVLRMRLPRVLLYSKRALPFITGTSCAPRAERRRTAVSERGCKVHQ